MSTPRLGTLNTGKYDRRAETARIEADWGDNARWAGITRSYSAEDVVRLRGSIKRDNTIAKLGAEKLWNLLQLGVNASSALTGGEAVQQVRAGAQAIYLSCSHATADQTTAETIRPDQSLYAINSVPSLVRRINNAFERADQIQWKAGTSANLNESCDFIDYFAPIIADAEAHNGSALNAFELMKNMIRAGAAGVHFDDQFTSAKQRNQMSCSAENRIQENNVLMPTSEVVQKLSAARLAADAEDVSTLIIARTTANTSNLLSSDDDARDRAFMTGERSEEGFYEARGGIEQAIARGLAYAPYADMLWLEIAPENLEDARQFAEAIRREYPNQLLACSCASTNEQTMADMQKTLATMGYQFQFIAPIAVRECELVHHKNMAA
ncbi:MAG: isocitrate lyase/phosphoenolpyruvate mutase family protein [Spongiibacteraceae bacterium]